MKKLKRKRHGKQNKFKWHTEIFTFSKRKNIHDDPKPTNNRFYFALSLPHLRAAPCPIAAASLYLCLAHSSVNCVIVCIRYELLQWSARLYYLFVIPCRSNLDEFADLLPTLAHTSFFFYSFHVDSEQKLVNSMSEGKCDGKTHFHKGKEELLRARWHYPDEYCVRSRTHKHWFLSRLLRAELWLTLLALLLHYY